MRLAPPVAQAVATAEKPSNHRKSRQKERIGGSARGGAGAGWDQGPERAAHEATGSAAGAYRPAEKALSRSARPMDRRSRTGPPTACRAWTCRRAVDEESNLEKRRPVLGGQDHLPRHRIRRRPHGIGEKVEPGKSIPSQAELHFRAHDIGASECSRVDASVNPPQIVRVQGRSVQPLCGGGLRGPQGRQGSCGEHLERSTSWRRHRHRWMQGPEQHGGRSGTSRRSHGRQQHPLEAGIPSPGHEPRRPVDRCCAAGHRCSLHAQWLPTW